MIGLGLGSFMSRPYLPAPVFHSPPATRARRCMGGDEGGLGENRHSPAYPYAYAYALSLSLSWQRRRRRRRWWWWWWWWWWYEESRRVDHLDLRFVHLLLWVWVWVRSSSIPSPSRPTRGAAMLPSAPCDGASKDSEVTRGRLGVERDKG